MHGGLSEKRNSELPPREKRTLRAALDGSPARPDGKCVRSSGDDHDFTDDQTPAAAHNDGAVCAR